MNSTRKKRVTKQRNAAELSSSAFYAVVTVDVIKDARLNATAVRLFCLLDSRQTSASRVRVSQQTLAADLNTKVRAIQYAVKQLVNAGYLDVQRTGRTNGYRVENPARKRAVDQAAKALLDQITTPTITENPPISTAEIAAKQPPDWFKETPATKAETKAPAPKDDGLPNGYLEALRGSLKDDRRHSVDLNTSTSRSALKSLSAAGYSAEQIAANLNGADLSTARNPGGVLASRLKSLDDSGVTPPKPKPTEAERPLSPFVKWGFRAELTPMEAEISAWKDAGGVVRWSPGDGYELMSAMGDLYYQINSDRVGEVAVTDHLSGTKPRYRNGLSEVIAEIASLRRTVFPIPIRRLSDVERWNLEHPKDSAYLEVEAVYVADAVARGEHPEVARALFDSSWDGSAKAAEIAAEIAAALEPEGTTADIAAREALADVVLAGSAPMSVIADIQQVAEGMRL